MGDIEQTAALLGRAQAVLGQVEPVCDDLMGEVTGKKPVQDWGAVNALLLQSARLLRDIEAHWAALEGKSHPNQEAEYGGDTAAGLGAEWEALRRDEEVRE